LRDRISALELKLAELTGAIDILRAARTRHSCARRVALNRTPNVEFTDNDVDQMDVVGDLIRHLKSARVPKGDDAAVASREPTIGLSTCSTPLTSRLRRAAEQLARSLVQWQNHFRLGFRH